MFFRKFLSLVMVASLLSSCSWLRDKPKAQKTFENGELDLSCLRVMPNQLRELFAGHYSDSAQDQNSVKSIWGCLDRSLNTFSKYTHGSHSEYYTGAELLDFANRYLPENSLFSEKLVSSIFKLKTSVLGGTSQNISQVEIQKLRVKLKRFGEIILPLSPYISTLLKPYDNFVDGKNQQAGDQLNKFVAEFAILLGDSENTVTWLDLTQFVGELEKYLKSPNPTALTVVKEQIQVFQYLKVLVVGGDEFGIERSKWQPIFKSISAIYNALYLTTTSGEMMDQLGIEIQSTDQEQKRATEKLSGALKVLKNDPSLYSRSTIQLLADRWSKVLILNAVLYPKSQGKLAIKSFLGSPTLRKLTAYLMDEVEQVKSGDQSVKTISQIAENLAQLIEQTSIDQNSALNINALRDYTAQLKPLFANEKDYAVMDSALSILQDVSSIMIGKDSGNLSSKDFRNLLQKTSDLYAAWRTKNPADFNEALSASLSILIRQPNAYLVSVDQVQSLLKKCERLFVKLELTATIDWKMISDMVVNGAKLKSVLFGNTDQNITNYELTQIFNTWNAFANKVPMDVALENLAKFFQNNPYSSVKIPDLLSAVNAFLPADQKLDQLGVNAELVGSIKSFLIGGNAQVLDRSEYVKIAQIGFTIMRNLNPVLKNLPSDFKMGLNSSTFAVFEAAIQGLIDDKSYQFSNAALKDLLLSQLQKIGMNIQPQTVDKLLRGLNFRILDGNHGKKPKVIPATFSSSKLVGIKQFIEKTKLDYQDFEQAFAGLDSTQSMPGSEIFKRLTRSDTKLILGSLHPILNGRTSLPYFSGNGKPNTDYYLMDLNYKALIYHGLMWIFPGYELEPDPKKPGDTHRLSINDLIDLFDDINDAVYELGLSFSPESAQASAVKRMQNINLFTSTGNGDPYIDVMETTDFLTTTFAGKNLLDEVRKTLVKNCYPQNTSFATQDRFSFTCLKNEFFGKSQFAGFYQKVIPQMNAHYQSLNAVDAEQFRKATLTTVKAGWKEDGEMKLSDLETLVSIPYYVENIFLRLDHNFDGMLTFTEGMAGFPIFCREIKKAAGDSIKGSCETNEEPRQVEAIYGHLLMKGFAPDGITPDLNMWQKIKVAKDFLVWNFQWNHLNRDPAVRDAQPPYLYRKDLLSIISNLSTTIAPPPAPAPLSASASSDSGLLYGEQSEP